MTDFRSYAGLRLEAAPGPIVLTGANGAGKTNILEAVSYLSPGRGLRRSRLAEVTRRTATNGWAVAADLGGPAGAFAIGTGLVAGAAPGRERRVVHLDGQPARGAAALAEVLAMAWLTPSMDRLFQEEAAGRRRFLDRLVYAFDPSHARRLAAYEHALRQRTRLLQSGITGTEWLGALEQTIAEHGVAVAAARRETVARLRLGLAQRSGPFPSASVAVAGSVENSLDHLAAVDAESLFRDQLVQSRVRDRDAGGAAVGPHRSDLVAHHAGHGTPAAQCSTGEQKAMLIAIILGHARLVAAHRGSAPILLLDEVTAHLDGDRRAALFEELLALNTQVWLTGTDRATFAGLAGQAQFFDVSAGRVACYDGRDHENRP